MRVDHDIETRISRPSEGARLHYARGEELILNLLSAYEAAVLETGDELLFCVKPKGQRDTARLVLVTITDADADPDTEGLYRKTFSGRTTAIQTLLGLGDDDTSTDIPSRMVECCFVLRPAATPTEEQVGNTFDLILEVPPFDPDDTDPDPVADNGILSISYDSATRLLTLDTVDDGEVTIPVPVAFTNSYLALKCPDGTTRYVALSASPP